MFYAAFPPEINSGRMYTGAGSGPLLAAATAWSELAEELQEAVASYSTVISSLTSGPWLGPTALRMAAAVAPYLTWMQTTAAQAAETASQATAAASAYETAFASLVPPAEITANRVQLASLVATNVIQQNDAAIAATEAQYGEMWAQDALAMNTYAASSAAASKLTPYTEPQQTANAAGIAAQSVAAAQAAATEAGSGAQTVSAATTYTGSPLLQWLANLSTDYTSTLNGLLNSMFGPSGASTFSALFSAVKTPLGFTTPFNDIGLLTNFPVSQFLKFSPAPGFGLPPKEGLNGGLLSPWYGRGWLTSSVSASMGDTGTQVGKLSVPPSWAAATPTVRTAAAALSAAGTQVVPAAVLGEVGLFSSMSVAGMLGSAIGAGAPAVASANGVRGRITPLKDLKDSTGKHSREQLKRLVAQISERPASVQHHHVDPEGLDSLLAQLSTVPGIHAVHLAKKARGESCRPKLRDVDRQHH